MSVTRRWRGLGLIVVVGAMLVATSTARAADARFDLSAGIGYSHVWLDGSAAPFDERDGIRIEPRFSFALSEGSPLRLGFGVGISGFEKREDTDGFVVIDDEVFAFDADDVQALSLIVPEFQISWRQTFGGDHRWYIEPGAAVGVVIGNYWVGEESFWFRDEDISEWDATIAGRPFLRAGYQWNHFMLGVETSYLFGGSLDLTDEIQGDVREFYAGVFFGGRW
jgi:hypothetical protein